MKRMRLALVLMLLIAATLGTDIATAVSKSPTAAKACTDRNGTLSLLSHGRCAKGAHQLTLSVSGPRGNPGAAGATGPVGAVGSAGATGGTGSQGPGAVSEVLDTTGTETGPTISADGFTLQGTCAPYNTGEQAYLSVSSAVPFIVEGQANSSTVGSAGAGYSRVGPTASLAAGPNQVDSAAGGTGSTSFLLSAQSTGSGADESVTAELLVSAGEASKPVALNLYIVAFTSGRCQVDVQATPSS